MGIQSKPSQAQGGIQGVSKGNPRGIQGVSSQTQSKSKGVSCRPLTVEAGLVVLLSGEGGRSSVVAGVPGT